MAKIREEHVTHNGKWEINGTIAKGFIWGVVIDRAKAPVRTYLWYVNDAGVICFENQRQRFIPKYAQRCIKSMAQIIEEKSGGNKERIQLAK